MDSDEEVLALALLIRRRRRYIRCKRKYWEHPIIEARLINGQFYTLYNELRQDDVKFFNYFRMSMSSFDELLNILRIHITRQDTCMRNSISAEERIVLTLRYLASGCTFTDLHYSYKYGVSTIANIVQDTCRNIYKVLQDICMPVLTEKKWLDIADGFKKNAQFPNCLGAIDGKHVRVIKPQHSGSLFRNYKHYFSVVLLAVCDSNYNFIFIDVGSYGKSSDSQIFKNSELFKKIEQNNLNVPRPTPISSSGEPLPFTFIGDEAFALTDYMQRPYGGKNLTMKKRIYNYRLSRARRFIECTFGILTNKWRIFHRPMNVSVNFATDIVKACCILHNFVRERDGYKFDDTLEVAGIEDREHHGMPQARNKSAIAIRDKFADYFSSEEGSVPWQQSKI